MATFVLAGRGHRVHGQHSAPSKAFLLAPGANKLLARQGGFDTLAMFD
jgi:hypothetical protein